MKKITITLYAFSELNKEAQHKALVENRTINANFGWWQQLEQEAKDLQVHIKRFDIEKDIPKVDGYIFGSQLETARLILKKFGKETTLYQLADQFIKEQKPIEKELNAPTITSFRMKDLETQTFVNEKHFANNIFECYAYLLKSEYYERITDAALLKSEYYERITDAAIIKTFEDSEYTFEQDGRMNNSKGNEQDDTEQITDIKALNKRLYSVLSDVFNSHPHMGGKLEYSHKDHEYIGNTLDLIKIKYYGEEPDGDRETELSNDKETEMLDDEEAYYEMVTRFTNMGF